MPTEHAHHCWFLTGPTASGKTAVGIAVAQAIDAEIISMDSMAVYRGMDIGTAKPTPAERAAAPHHMIDVVEPTDDFSVAEFVGRVNTLVPQIRSRSRQTLFVGGTPLYLKAVLRGLFNGPPADAALRATLAEEAARHGDAWLHRQLAGVDPEAASRLNVRDTKRLIRALEVHRLTGRPISEWQQEFDRGLPADACRVFVLDWPRPTLYDRIDRRVDAMFSAGLLEEVQRLLDDGGGLGQTARQAVGYREVIAHIEGRHDLATAIELVKRNSRRLAKKQLTWLRSLSECTWVAMSDDVTPVQTAAKILAIEAGRRSSPVPPSPAPGSSSR